MQINEIKVYKLECDDKYLDVNGYYDEDKYLHYIKYDNRWYGHMAGGHLQKLSSEDYTERKNPGSLASKLERVYKEMSPFKGQMELF